MKESWEKEKASAILNKTEQTKEQEMGLKHEHSSNEYNSAFMNACIVSCMLLTTKCRPFPVRWFSRNIAIQGRRC